MNIIPIKSEDAHPWLLQKHYAKRLCPISFAFGAFVEGKLIGVVTYGTPVEMCKHKEFYSHEPIH